MKKLILAVLMIPLMFVFSSATAEQTETVSSDEQNKYADSIISVIDGVHIPTLVLIDIQHDFPGHAAIEAVEINANSDKGVRLRVSQYDDPDDYEGFYLIYDSDWERIAKSDIIPPKPKPKAEPEPKPEPKPEEDVQPEPQSEPDAAQTDEPESDNIEIQPPPAEEEPNQNDNEPDEEVIPDNEEPV